MIRSLLPKELEEFITKHELKYLGQGRHRSGFLTKSGKYVIKFPMGAVGDWANEGEAWDYSKDKTNLARCRCIEVSGHILLIMEFVQKPGTEVLPEWVKFVDCQQVGYTRSGRLVAYDWR